MRAQQEQLRAQQQEAQAQQQQQQARQAGEALVGRAVTITGLKKKPEMNGKTGSIQGVDLETGRYLVRVTGQPQSFALLHTNILLQPSPTDQLQATLRAKLHAQAQAQARAHAQARAQQAQAQAQQRERAMMHQKNLQDAIRSLKLPCVPSSAAQLKAAWKAQAKLHHPDRNVNCTTAEQEASAVAFRAAQAGYDYFKSRLPNLK